MLFYGNFSFYILIQMNSIIKKFYKYCICAAQVQRFLNSCTMKRSTRQICRLQKGMVIYMKLRTKIQISFISTMAVLLIIIGIVTQNVNAAIITTLTNSSIATSATLASDHISKQLKDYLNVVTMVGSSEIISDSDTPIKEKSSFLNKYVEKYGFTSANLLDSRGVSLIDGTDFGDRDYVISALEGNTNVSDVTLSKYTNTYGVSIAAPVINTAGHISGVVYFRLDIDFMMDVIKSITISDNSYAYLVDNKGNIIVHPNSSLILNFNLNDQQGSVAELGKAIKETNSGDSTYEYNNETIMCGFGPVGNTNGWTIIIAAPETDFTPYIERVNRISIIMDIIAIIIAIIFSAVLASSISKPICRVENALVAVADGDFSLNLPTIRRKDEIGILQNTTVSLVHTLSDIIGQANEIMDSIANYDLSVKDMANYPGEFDKLSDSVNSIKHIMNNLILEVKNSVYTVQNGSHEIAQATTALSEGAVSQADSIQTLVSEFDDMAARIDSNSENEELINQKLDTLDENIHTANGQMEHLMAAVDSVETMSADIQKIVGTIDSIAFQTNILSLNASVEAARAGETGRGFAVVAEEVRNLAVKCREASMKTSELVNACVDSITNAKLCADATFESLSGIVTDSSEISVAFKDIANDTMEQAHKSKRIQDEVNNISNVVQTNTSTAQETAASTTLLSEQALHLKKMIEKFKISTK